MRKTMVSCTLIALASWAALPAAAAGLEPGARIRWVSGDDPNTIRIGAVRGIRSDTLFVTDERDSSRQSVPLSAVSQLEVSQGKTYHVGPYALVGGVSGGLIGYAMAKSMDDLGKSIASFWGGEPVQSHTSYTSEFL